MVSNVSGQGLSGAVKRARNLYRQAAESAVHFQWLALLAARLLVARVFFLSGLTKWDGFAIRDDTFYLFADEYFSKYALPAPVTNAFAVASSIGEVALPILLAFGLLSRVAALGLMAMTLVIQVFVYPDAWWNVHAWWLALLALIVVSGPGAVSVDRRIGLEGPPK